MSYDEDLEHMIILPKLTLTKLPSYDKYFRTRPLWPKICWMRATKSCNKVAKILTLRWRHNDHAGVSNHQPHGCLLNRFFRRKSKKTSKLRVTGLCSGNSPGTGEFPAQMASYAENVSIWWRHHEVFRASIKINRPMTLCGYALINSKLNSSTTTVSKYIHSVIK